MTETLRFSDKIAWIATVAMFSSITIFESYTWGKYILAATCMIVFLCDATEGRLKYPFYFRKFQEFMIMLIMYTFLSTFWSISPSDCLTKTYTFVQIFICIWILYNHYAKFETVGQLIQVIKWASYVISIYSIYYYGLDYLRQMMDSAERIGNSYTNINTIGMLAATGIVIQLDELVRHRHLGLSIISSFFCVPSFIMVITTQSRKAIIMLVFGILMVVIFRNMRNKNFIRNFLVVVAVLLAAFFLLRYLMTLEIFSGVNERFGYLIAQFSGVGNAGRSGLIREQMIELGIDIFKRNPLVGIGVGCPHVIAAERISYDAYLHNNFVEMLAGGGIIGFCVFYYAYAYLFVNFIKYRAYKDEYFITCIVLMLLFLSMDYANVSAYSKGTYFYYMVFFLAVQKMQERAYNYDTINVEEHVYTNGQSLKVKM